MNLNPEDLKKEIDGLVDLLKGWKTDGRRHPARPMMKEKLKTLKKNYNILETATVLNVKTGEKTPYLEYLGKHKP